MATHETLSGHTIEYEPTPELAAFLARLQALLDDPSKREADMIALAYSRENPLLEPWPFDASRGMVTAAVLAEPAYHVIGDMLFRKRVQDTGTDVAKIAARYTLTIGETAERLGIHESAVRQGIAARRLSSWVKDGRHYLDPVAVDSYKVGPHGPKPPAPRPSNLTPLRVVLGRVQGYNLKVKYPGELEGEERIAEHTIAGNVPRWARVAVFTGHAGTARMFVLEPDPDAEEQTLEHNAFSVRGRFKIVEKINNAAKAGEAWKRFEAA